MKPVLVHYINVGNLDEADVQGYIGSIADSCKDSYKGEYHALFIPVRGQETKVECLNPIALDKGEERDKIINNINNLKFNVGEMIRKAPYMSKNILLIERI